MSQDETIKIGMFDLHKVTSFFFSFLIFISSYQGTAQANSNLVNYEPIKQQEATSVIRPPKALFGHILLADDVQTKALEDFKVKQKSIKSFRKDVRERNQQAVTSLRLLLSDFGIRISDRKTLNRIIRQFHQEEPLEIRKEIYLDWESGDLKRIESANMYFFQFIREVKDRHDIENPTSTKRAVVNIFHEIISAEYIGKKEIRLFRKVLSKLGLPAHTHHDEFIRIFLQDFKHHQFEKEKDNDHKNLRFKDKDILKGVNKIKVYFDQMHFNNLKEMTRFTNIVKGFPAQYILFQAAIGSMIYRENITDPLIYDAQTKPGYMQEFMSQSLNPSSVLSFFIFIMVSQKTNYLFYKYGSKFDKKFLRTLAPHMGLASGFFVSALAMELYQDPDFKECVKTLTSNKTASDFHISPCEKSYATWLKSKWSTYAVDIVGLLGASWISHKIIRGLLIATRATSFGGSMLYKVAQKIGPRASGWVGFFITIYAFMEVHHFLDKFVGKSAKAYLKMQGIQSDIFSKLKPMSSEFLKLEEPNPKLEKDIVQSIKLIGRRFMDWSSVKGQDYEWSFSLWLRKTNKISLFYKQSRELLEHLFNQTNQFYDYSMNILWDEELPTNQGFLIDLKAFHSNRSHYVSLICPHLKSKKIAEEFIPTWLKFCDNPKEMNIYPSDMISLSSEAIFIVSELLGNSKKDFDFSLYLSKNTEDLFSTNPRYSIQNLPTESRIKLTQALFKAVYYPDESSHYQSYLNQEKARLARNKKFQALLDQKSEDFKDSYKDQCENDFISDEDIKKCIQNSNAFISHYMQAVFVEDYVRDKILATAVYLIKKDILINPTESFSESLNNYQQPKYVSFGQLNLRTVRDIFDFIRVYKRGEIIFEFQAQNYEFLKNDLELSHNQKKEIKSIESYPYEFFQNIICGTEKIDKEDHFISPQLFKELSFICEELSGLKNKQVLFNQILFHRPVKNKGQTYSNFWSLLVSHIENNFVTSKDFLEFFENKAKDRIDYLANDNLKSLDNLNKKYLLPEMINSDSEVTERKSCEDIQDYYHPKKLLDNQFRGLGISLFQVIFWMNQLEKRYGKTLSFKCKFVETLKLYHDSYARTQGPYLVVPSKEEKEKMILKFQKGEDVPFTQVIDNKIVPVLISPQMILYSVLEDSYYKGKNLQGVMGFLRNNSPVPQTEDAIEYALLYELKMSLDNFFQRLHLLRMKERVEEGLQH